VVTDETVAPLYLERVLDSIAGSAGSIPRDRCIAVAIPAGEQHKTREQWARVTDELLGARCGRDTTIVALGGGVVGDLAGFVAATYMRGVPVVQCPTTLLAMVDASVGGKTGVDTPAGKNLVGAFHPPAAVVADPSVLATLPARELRAGLAEVLKHGVIADAGELERLRALPPSPGSESFSADQFVALVARSVAIKAEIVRADEREGGVRKVLNFGHTIGHAVEAASGFALLHGEAVAVGMIAESRLAERAGVAESGTAGAVEVAVGDLGLPTRIPHGLGAAQLLALTRADKKTRRSTVEYALPRRIGQMAGRDAGWAVPIDDALVLGVLEELASG
jgi:3-dehydroquinate synthase